MCSSDSRQIAALELNRYLLRYAWQNQQAGAARTYVGSCAVKNAARGRKDSQSR